MCAQGATETSLKIAKCCTKLYSFWKKLNSLVREDAEYIRLARTINNYYQLVKVPHYSS